MSDAAHALVSTHGTNRAHVAVCSCGWESTPASEAHAHARWRIHLGSQKAAASCARAEVTINVARSRVEELVAIRTKTATRRADLRDQRRRFAADGERRREAALDPPNPFDRAQMLERAREIAGMSSTDLWCSYFALGGDLQHDSLTAVLQGQRTTSHRELNRVAVALNERFAEEGFGYPLDYWPNR
ncbi:MAG TPA: hypothetical protein VH914_15825 [Acidimicrobiia bacterium]|nr:hypothetical protein [Acidimicrobiia bacterium]